MMLFNVLSDLRKSEPNFMLDHKPQLDGYLEANLSHSESAVNLRTNASANLGEFNNLFLEEPILSFPSFGSSWVTCTRKPFTFRGNCLNFVSSRPNDESSAKDKEPQSTFRSQREHAASKRHKLFLQISAKQCKLFCLNPSCQHTPVYVDLRDSLNSRIIGEYLLTTREPFGKVHRYSTLGDFFKDS